MTDINITRKCAVCKEYINLDTDDFVYVKDKYYHFNHIVEEKLSKPRNKLSKEELVEKYRKIQNDNKKDIEYKKEKDRLFKWLQNTYNTVVIPKYFYMKMDSVFDGTYKGLSRGIPPEDILDMWKRKINELNRINNQNKNKGKVLIGVARINYDLAIILSKYDSYLKWKEEQKLLENEKQNIINEANKPKINYDLINKSVEKNKNTSTNINDLLDEVF
jgi:hypothetical protein